MKMTLERTRFTFDGEHVPEHFNWIQKIGMIPFILKGEHLLPLHQHSKEIPFLPSPHPHVKVEFEEQL